MERINSCRKALNSIMSSLEYGRVCTLWDWRLHLAHGAYRIILDQRTTMTLVFDHLLREFVQRRGLRDDIGWSHCLKTSWAPKTRRIYRSRYSTLGANFHNFGIVIGHSRTQSSERNLNVSVHPFVWL